MHVQKKFVQSVGIFQFFANYSFEYKNRCLCIKYYRKLLICRLCETLSGGWILWQLHPSPHVRKREICLYVHSCLLYKTACYFCFICQFHKIHSIISCNILCLCIKKKKFIIKILNRNKHQIYTKVSHKKNTLFLKKKMQRKDKTFILVKNKNKYFQIFTFCHIHPAE